MTTCPDTGTLRAHLDGEAAGVDAHVTACARCAAEIEMLAADAAAVTGALALLAPPAVTATPAEAPDVPQARLRRPRRRPGLAVPAGARRAVAAVAAGVTALALVATPAGREAAASFLSQFRSERLTVVTFDPYAGFDPLTALSQLGSVEGMEGVSHVEPAASVAEAERRTGMTVAEPAAGTLPEAFAAQPPMILVNEATELRVEFDTAAVRGWLEQHGGGPAIPDGLGDTALVVQVPPAVALVYRAQDWQELVVGQAGLLVADTDGPLGLDEVRAFLLDLPGLPPQTADQLRAIDDWRTTLPLPVPAAELDWSEETVAGVPAVSLRGTSGFGSAVLWQAGGVVHGVGGLVDEDVARRVAEGLAQR